MSEKEKGGDGNNTELDSATLTWDNIAEDIDWLEEQAKNGDEETRAKAVRLIKENYANMQRILDEISNEKKSYDDPKAVVSNERVTEATSTEKKSRQLAAGEPFIPMTDEEAREAMKRRHEEQP